jgi:hypothetical protein
MRLGWICIDKPTRNKKMIEYVMDILWMALAAMPFVVGVTQPTGINASNLGAATRTVGRTNQSSVISDILAGLNLLTGQGETLNAAELAKLRKQGQTTDKRIKQLEDAIKKGGRPGKMAKWQAELAKLTAANTGRDSKIAELSSPDFAANKIRNAFSEQYGMRDSLLGRLSGAISPTSEYSRMQDALGRGVQARTTEAGMLGDRLMSQALTKVDQGGRLSPEAERDATQSARASMAARGLGTSGAGMAAEFLNRDRYSRQRDMENLSFASGVQSADLARRQANNAMMGDTDRFNLGLLGQSAMAADQERLRQLNVGQDQYNFAMSTDPRNAVMSLGQPFNRLTGAAEAGLGVASFNQNMQAANYNTLMNNNAYRDAANASKPQWWETGIGAVRSLFG